MCFICIDLVSHWCVLKAEIVINIMSPQGRNNGRQNSGFYLFIGSSREFRFSNDSRYLEGFHRLTALFHPEACQTKLSWVNILRARLGVCLIGGWVIRATSSCVRKQRRQGMFHHGWFMTSKWAIEQCFCIPALTNIEKKEKIGIYLGLLLFLFFFNTSLLEVCPPPTKQNHW